MKMVTSEMTTALVVDSPTPLAPPLVVKPQAQLICGVHVPCMGWEKAHGEAHGARVSSGVCHVCTVFAVCVQVAVEDV